MTLLIKSHTELCMRGRIYSDQRCPLCGSAYQHIDRKRGLFCPTHHDQQANRLFTVQFGRKLRKRFDNFLSAERFLDGLRYEVDRGTFDYRNYLSSNPLSFTLLSEKYLEKKSIKVKSGTYSHLKRYISVFQEYFENTNVKEIHYSHIDDLLDSLDVSDKTKSNYLSCLKNFYNWLLQRKEIDRSNLPEFPQINYELGYRKTVTKETQAAIVEEVKRLTYHLTPKIWLGIKWLTTYISIRPGEMRNLKEEHIDRQQQFFFIPHPKEKRPKIVPLIQEDIEILSRIPEGLPDLYFFRYSSNYKRCTPGQRFGQRVFYKWWKKACANLGIEGVDLYGGTRHSSAIGLREFATPEQIKRATMHSTNKAFERYYIPSRIELQELYQATKCDTGVIRKRHKKIR